MARLASKSGKAARRRLRYQARAPGGHCRNQFVRVELLS
jgi:hypothetical protein